jgi:hypothetical protein
MIVIQSDIDYNPFEELKKTNFEHITKGRSAATLVECDGDKIPIVRTTTIYKNPPIKFNDLHRTIIKKVECKFNNAMIELYDDHYKSMKFHTDQALDLEDKSSIAIYSCYKFPDKPNRKLIVINKATQQISEIILEHNSIVVFDLQTNSQHMHKIVLIDGRSNEWIGITYRVSKTYVDPNNPNIKLANEEERKEFYMQKKMENELIDFKYKPISYTINPSDLLALNNHHHSN